MAAYLVPSVYATGVKVTREEWAGLDMQAHAICPQMVPGQVEMRQLLREGMKLTDGKAAGFSGELLDLERALWTFVTVAGVEPTNNGAERALRPAVLWRKGCFGAASADGNRFVERILTVRATCQQQERHLWTFLAAPLTAYWADLPAPPLITTPH